MHLSSLEGAGRGPGIILDRSSPKRKYIENRLK